MLFLNHIIHPLNTIKIVLLAITEITYQVMALHLLTFKILTMKRKITLSKVLIAFILSSMGILIVFNILRPYVEKIKIDIPSDFHICSDSTHKTCDGNCECDGMNCNSIFNVSKPVPVGNGVFVLIEKNEQYPNIKNIAYTYSLKTANRLISQNYKIIFISDYVYFFEYSNLDTLKNFINL